MVLFLHQAMSIFRIYALILSMVVMWMIPLSGYAQESRAATREILSQTEMSWDGVLYENYPTGKPQTTVLKVTIPANTSTPWHTHPVISSAYVLSGELTMERKSAKGEKGTERKIIKAGEVLPEMVGVPHHSITGNSPVVLIVFYAGSKGIPLSEAVVP